MLTGLKSFPKFPDLTASIVPYAMLIRNDFPKIGGGGGGDTKNVFKIVVLQTSTIFYTSQLQACQLQPIFSTFSIACEVYKYGPKLK